MKQSWRVKLFEARALSGIANGATADFVEVFGVQADGPDEAKRAATEWLTVRGHTLRSVNVLTEPRSLIVYVAAGSVEAAKKKASGEKS